MKWILKILKIIYLVKIIILFLFVQIQIRLIIKIILIQFKKKLVTNNNKQFIKKVFKKINTNYIDKKITKKNIKTISSIEKSTSRNKQSNSINQNKKVSSSSSYLGHKYISSYNNKQLFSISKIGKIPHHSKSKSIFSYKSKSKSKSKFYLKFYSFFFQKKLYAKIMNIIIIFLH